MPILYHCIFHSFSPNFIEIGQYLAELGGVLCARKKTHSARKKTPCAQESVAQDQLSTSNEPLYYYRFTVCVCVSGMYLNAYISAVYGPILLKFGLSVLCCIAREKKHFPRKKKHFPREKNHFAREIIWLKTAVHFQMNPVVWLKSAV